MNKNLKAQTNKELVANFKAVSQQSKKLEVDLLLFMIEVKRRQLHGLYGYYNLARFCVAEIGISEDAAWKRSAAINTFYNYPQFFELLKEGKTYVSQIAMVAAKITEANSDQILDFIPGKSKNELKFFLSRIDLDGNIKPKEEETISVKIDCPRATYEKLQRTRGLMQQKMRFPRNEDVLDRSLDAYLDKHDPMRKAERAEHRKNNFRNKSEAACPGASGYKKSLNVSSSDKHSIFLRDQGQCTYVSPFGKRCEEKSVLQIDHIIMKCRGGSNGPNNLRLLCSTHNRFVAIEKIGKKYIEPHMARSV